MSLVTPLLEIAATLGIDRLDLVQAEKRDLLQGTFPVSTEQLARLADGQVRAFVDAYENASLHIELREVVEFDPFRGDDLETFQAEARGHYELVINIDKRQLVQKYGPSETVNVVMYFFIESLHRDLAMGINAIESHLWSDYDKCLMILVVEGSDVQLRGEWLVVVGGASLDQWQPPLPASGPDLARAVSMRSHRDRLIGWDTEWVTGLTPLHFHVSGSSEDGLLRHLIDAQFVKLAALYTCDRARARPRPGELSEVRAEFRGMQHVAVIPIDEALPISHSQDSIDAVAGLIDWTYPPEEPAQAASIGDRLPFVQTRVAQALEPRDETARLTAFVEEMPQLLEGLEWHWKAFIEGKVSSYLDRVRELEDLVGQTVLRFTDQAGELVKGLSDAMLAAIAVLIGSFLAAAFKTPFNETLFRVAMWAYAAYLLLFPGLFGLASSATRLQRAKTDFEARQLSFEQALYPDKVKEIVASRVTKASSSYWRWFAVVAAIYLIVAGTAVAGGSIIPTLIENGTEGRESKQGETESGAEPERSSSQTPNN